MKKIGYLGPPGTFSEQAASQWVQIKYLEPVEMVPCNTIPEVVAGVVNASVDQGVLPLENSIEGSVNLSLDLLAAGDLTIQGEVVLEIHQCLAGLASLLSEIKMVYSHPQALAQCRDFLARELPGASLREATSTAEAARLVSQGPAAFAAIAPPQAAARYGLTVLAQDIQEYADNKTRFAIIGHGRIPPAGRDKTSLVMALPQNKPGALYSVLHEFAAANINLTKIESRPTKKVLGDYLFFIDCEGHADIQPLKSVLERLSPQTVLLKVLGSYQQDDGKGE